MNGRVNQLQLGHLQHRYKETRFVVLSFLFHTYTTYKMNLLQLTSVVFFVIGLYCVCSTGRLVGYGMCLVGCTSLLYHSSYNDTLRTLDVCSNVSLGTYFILQEVPFNLWVTRLSWAFLSVFGFLNSATTTANENPLLHSILVHVPVLLGFLCIANE